MTGLKVWNFFGDADDVVIGYEMVPIDGTGGTLGSAKPISKRGNTRSTISGIMKFDEVGFANMSNRSKYICHA